MQVVKDFTGNRIVSSSLSVPRIPEVHQFDFSFDTPDLNAGVSILTMNPGDILLDAWVITEIDFNGTGLLWDIGTFNPLSGSPTVGILNNWSANGPGRISTADTQQLDYSLMSDAFTSMSSCFASATTYAWQTKFIQTSPLKFVVSQSGDQNAAAIGGTAGKASLYVQISRAGQ